MTYRKSSYSMANGNCVEVDAIPLPVYRKSSYSASGDCVEVAENWRKSRFSNSSGGNCVEVAEDWRTSSASSFNGQCAEVASARPGVQVRDTKQEDEGYPVILQFGGVEWGAFIERVKTGTEF